MKTTEVQAPPTKPSGIPWLGEVPAHWEVKRLRFVVQKIGSGKTPKGGAESYATEGVVFIRSQNVYDDGLRLDDVVYIDDETDEDMSGTRVKPNDVLLNITGASIGRCAPVPDDLGPANVNQHVAIIRPEREKVDQRFLHAFLCSQATKAAILADEVGSSREALNFEQIAGLPILLPPLPEQRAIAAFLDERTARIDALVARKRRLVQLLKEKRQALITRAVTRGLDPKVKMKESGVPWLGEVPEHWEVKRLRFVVQKIGSGKTPKGGAESYATEGVVFIRSQNVYDDGLRLDDVVYIDDETDEDMSGTRVKPNDVLLNITGASIGRCAPVPDDLGPANVNQHVAIIRPEREKVDQRFLHAFLCSQATKAAILADEVGSSREALNFEQIAGLPILLPPLPEQRAIASYLDDRTARIDNLITKIEQAVERLQEYRTALISAAVTGKVRIPIGRSEDQMIGQ